MNQPKQITAVVKSQRPLTNDIFELCLSAKELAAKARPGQFVSLYCKEGGRLLPRPISLCEIHKEDGTLTLVYRIAGEGTREFSQLVAGDCITVTGPLGNGFHTEDVKPNMHSILFGGGIGIPPMLALAKALPGEKTILLGYRDQNTFLAERFAPYGRVLIASDDGSIGVKGTVLTAYQNAQLHGDIFFACGPKPMLAGIATLATEQGTVAQLSLEERMACGIGACLACVCKTKEKDAHSEVNNARVCKEGPVFYADTIVL